MCRHRQQRTQPRIELIGADAAEPVLENQADIFGDLDRRQKAVYP